MFNSLVECLHEDDSADVRDEKLNANFKKAMDRISSLTKEVEDLSSRVDELENERNRSK